MRVSAADYARFVEVRRRFDAGRRISRPADLDELEAIGASSPEFADAHILAATVALGLHRDDKDAAFLQRARRAIERGLRLGGDSPALYGAAIRLTDATGVTIFGPRGGAPGGESPRMAADYQLPWNLYALTADPVAALAPARRPNTAPDISPAPPR